MTKLTPDEQPRVWLLFRDSGEYGSFSRAELIAVYATEAAAQAARAAYPQDEQRDLMVDSEPVLSEGAT